MKRTGDEVVLYAGAEDVFGLEEGARNLVEARDVVLVVLDGVEGHGEREVGDAGVDAAGHLVVLEVVVVHALLQVVEEEVVRGAVFLGEALGRDSLDADKVGGAGLMALRGGGEGVVAELVVVAVVADARGEGGGELEGGLPGLGEEGVLGGQARGYRARGLGVGDRGKGDQAQGRGGEEGFAHGCEGIRARREGGGRGRREGFPGDRRRRLGLARWRGGRQFRRSGHGRSRGRGGRRV